MLRNLVPSYFTCRCLPLPKLTTLCRLACPAYTPGGRPLESVDLLLVCDSYLGLDQQYTIPLGSGGGSGGATGAPPLPLVGQAARRARRQEQQEARRQHAAGEAAEEQQGAAAPMEVDAQQEQRQQQVGPAAAGGAGEALPQRAPRRQRGPAARQLAQAEPTLDCRLDGGGGS